jgi:hypothetical protein
MAEIRKTILYVLFVGFTALILHSSCEETPVTPITTPEPCINKFSLVNPTDGETVDSTTIIEVEIDCLDAVKKVGFYVDESPIGFDSISPYEITWYAGFWAEDSIHSIAAVVTDSSDVIIGSDTITVFVDPIAIIEPEIIFPREGEVITEPGTEIEISLYSVEGAVRYRYSEPNKPYYGWLSCSGGICTSDYPIVTWFGGCREAGWILMIDTPGKTIFRYYSYHVAIDCE